MNIGDTYRLKGENNLALKYQLMVISKQIKLRDSLNLITTYTGIAETYINLRLYSSAIEYLNKANVLAEKFNRKRDKSDIYATYKQICLAINKPLLALQYPEKYHEMKDSLMNEEIYKNMAELNSKYESDKKDNEINLLNKNKVIDRMRIKQQAIQRNIFIAGFLVVLLLSGFIFRGYRQKQKANKIITAQKHEVEEKSKQIEEKQREILDSIHYARKIQNSLLTTEKYLKKKLG